MMLWISLLTTGVLAFPVAADLFSRMPEHAHMVALDEENKRFVAFDSASRHLGYYHVNASHPTKRRVELQRGCHPMSAEDLKNFSNLSKMEDEANKHFPDKGKYNTVVNDENETWEHSAEVCASYTPKWNLLYDDGQLDCKVSRVEYSPSINFQTFPDLTVHSPSVYSKGDEWDIELPYNTGLCADYADMSFRNKETDQVTLKAQMKYSQKIPLPGEFIQVPGCTYYQDSQNCTVSGRVQMMFVLRGWIWFQYEKKVSPKDDPNDKHFKWAFKIEGVLPQMEDRGSFVDFQASGILHALGPNASDCPDANMTRRA